MRSGGGGEDCRLGREGLRGESLEWTRVILASSGRDKQVWFEWKEHVVITRNPRDLVTLHQS